MLGTTWHTVMVFLEPKTWDMQSIKNVGSGQTANHLRNVLHALQCSNEHTACTGCLGLALYCRENIFWTPEHLNTSGSGIPSGRSWGSIFGTQGTGQQMAAGLVGSQLAGWHGALWAAEQSLQITGMSPRWALQSWADSHLTRGAWSWCGCRLQSLYHSGVLPSTLLSL